LPKRCSSQPRLRCARVSIPLGERRACRLLTRFGIIAERSMSSTARMTSRLAARNLARHRGRTLLTLAAIVLGVAALIVAGGFVRDIYMQLGEAIIRSQSGHLQIGRAAFFAEGSRSPEKFLIGDLSAERANIQSVPGVEAAMARLSFTGLLGNGHTDLPIIGEGIEPGPEALLATALVFAAGRELRDSDRYGMTIGEGVAAALQLKPGDVASVVTTSIEGAMNTLEFEVVGVFRSFSKDYDARAIKLPLSAAQELLGTQSANTLVTLLHRTPDTAAIAHRLVPIVATRGLVVKTWDELNDFYENTVRLYDRQFGVLNLIILVMVALSVSSAVNMSVLERLGEFGTMRALGHRRTDVFRLVLVENALLGAVGAACGVLIGIAAALVISAAGIPMPPPPNSNVGYTARVQLMPDVVIGAFCIGWLATMLAAILPAWRVSRVPITEALQENV